VDKAEAEVVFIVVDLVTMAEAMVVDKDEVVDKGDAVEVKVMVVIVMMVCTSPEVLNSMMSAQ
jgi:Ca2+/H+ antiporter